MNWKSALDPKWKHDEEHFLHHYEMALEEFKLLKELDECELLTPMVKLHFEKLKKYLKENLNRYTKLTWMIKK